MNTKSILSLLIFAGGVASSILPLMGGTYTVRGDRVWVYSGVDGGKPVLYFGEFQSEIQVGDKSYSKFVITKSRTYNAEGQQDALSGEYLEKDLNHTLYYLREDNGKIYELMANGELAQDIDDELVTAKYDEVEIYDWNLTDGCTWTSNPFSQPWKEVWEIEPNEPKIRLCKDLFVEGKDCKAFTLSDLHEAFSHDLKFIEGIGPTCCGTIGDMDPRIASGQFTTSPFDRLNLRCVLNKNGDVIFGSDHEYTPLLEEGKEWGYINYYADNEYFWKGSPEFYRLCCGSPVAIDDHEYYPILKYSSYPRMEHPDTLVYMREDCGKVYLRHPRANLNEYDWDDIITICGNQDEYLLYDFTISEGDSYIFKLANYDSPYLDDKEITLKCIETGTIETAMGPRKYLKFKKSHHYQMFEYIVEGIGPIGNCNFAIPYRSQELMGMFQSFYDIDLLYQREISVPDDNGNLYQGNMIYQPEAFDAFGIYDPSVWFWGSKPVAEPENVTTSEEQTHLPDMSIYMGRGDWLTSPKEPIENITVMDVLGRELKQMSPNSTQVKFVRSDYDDHVIFIRVSTANGSRTFRYWSES